MHFMYIKYNVQIGTMYENTVVVSYVLSAGMSFQCVVF